MRKFPHFSPIIVEATSIGEKSGSIDGMLHSIAGHFDMEINHTVKNLTTLIEPILLGCIFVIVLGLALAIFLPMWGVGKAVLHKK
jgi:type II secretory pathway component PulF